MYCASLVVTTYDAVTLDSWLYCTNSVAIHIHSYLAIIFIANSTHYLCISLSAGFSWGGRAGEQEGWVGGCDCEGVGAGDKPKAG